MFREHRYRINPWPLGIVLTIFGMLSMQFLIVGISDVSSMESYVPDFAPVVGAMWLLTGFAWKFFPVFTGPDGLRATDGIGRYQNVRWEEIQKVSTFLGFLWIRHGKWGKALCLPIFLRDWPAFQKDVLLHAPDENPLRNYLAQY